MKRRLIVLFLAACVVAVVGAAIFVAAWSDPAVALSAIDRKYEPTITALTRYHGENARYPESLDELTDYGYVPVPPRDYRLAFAWQSLPLEYNPSSDFTSYSLAVPCTYILGSEPEIGMTATYNSELDAGWRFNP